MKQPKLRFPEFTGDWKQHKFEDVVTIGSGKDYKHLESGNVPVYGTGGYMLSVNQALSESEDAVGIGRKGTIDKPYILRAPFWTVDTLFYCIPNKGFDLTFTNCLFQNVDWKKKDESTGVPSLSKVIINNVKTYVPSLEEQQKIASLFSELDNLIQSAEKELEGYRELKQGMLQKMFPKKGEKVPEIRSPEFTGDWEQRKLRDISSLITKGTTPKDKSGTGEVNFIKVENINDFSGDITGTSKISLEEHQGYLKRSQLQEGDILFSIAGTLGRVTSVNKAILPANTNQALSIIRLKEGNLEYVKTCLKGNVVADFIRRNPTIGAQPNLSLEQISNLEIEMPSEAEQKKIGEYFQNIDSLIASQQQELDGYKELKKGLLQQMFC